MLFQRLPPSLFLRLGMLSALFASVAGTIVPQSAPARLTQETDIPIHLRVLRDKDHRYAVPLRLGGQQLDAGLDTGSVGIHVLARALHSSSVTATNQPSIYGYGSGVQLKGVKASTSLQLGSINGPVDFQLVKSIACLPDKPDCPARRISYDQYGIMGDGIPGAGFPAILGIKPNEDAPVPQPLFALGIRQWVVDLPSEHSDGRLILNPSPSSLEGFVQLPVFAAPDTRLHDAVRGCLVNEATQEKICGAIEMDSGAPGMKVTSADALPTPWAPGTPAALLFQNAQGVTRAIERFRTNQRPAMSRLTFQQEANRRFTVIHAGTSPYLCFSVAYGGDTLGLRPRQTTGEQPRGTLQ